MFRSILAGVLFLLASLVPVPASAQFEDLTCTLSITLDCRGSNCTAVSRNDGQNACSGAMLMGIFGPEGMGMRLTGPTSDFGGECFSFDDFGEGSPEEFDFPYAFCFGGGSLAPGQTMTMSAGVSGGSGAAGFEAFAVIYDEVSEEIFGYASTFDDFEVPTCTSVAAAPGSVASGLAYDVTWTPVIDQGATYEVQESTSPNFDANLVSRTTGALSSTFSHTVSQSTSYYYRVRPLSCDGAPGAFGPVARTVVSAAIPASAPRFDLVAPLGSTSTLLQQVFVANPGGGVTGFTATVDQPWVTVTPSSGTLPAAGVTLTLTANPRDLPVGATNATLTIAYSGPAGKTAYANEPKSVPVSVTLVTPVGSGSKSKATANAMVIPSVTHVSGLADFRSDVRLANASTSAINYQLIFTPVGQSGTPTTKTTVIQLKAGQTVALDDVVKNFFGFAAAGEAASGPLEIRPLGTSSPLSFASSRTYALSGTGTLGQFIPAVPLAQFLGVPESLPGSPAPLPVNKLSLQQVAQGTAYRTNFGLVEAAGEAATGNVRIFNPAGTLLHTEPFSLQPFEQRQINQFLNGKVPPIEDARLEVVLDGPGRVSAFASVIDNRTNDPLLVSPAIPEQISARRYVLPGVADLQSVTNFRSDVRLYNGGSTPVSATVRYAAQNTPGNTGPTATLQIAPGEVKVLDNVLPSLFSVTGTGGALVVETPSESSLVVTGRTYSKEGEGTYGQFIPGITSAEGTSLSERPLEILQVEESPAYRSNIGVFELTGQPARVRITANVPGSLSTPFVEIDLGAGEFRQYGSLLKNSLNLGNAYNARVSVQVIGGSGRVAAYASVIDNKTQDPTYVPAQ